MKRTTLSPRCVSPVCCASPPAPTKPACRRTWRRSSARKTSCTSGRSAWSASATSRTSSSPSTSIRNRRTTARSCDQRVGGRAQRSAPHRSHRRPPFPVGDHARHQPDVHLRHPHRPRETEARADHRRLRKRQRRRRRSAHQLCAARPHAADGAFEQQGPRRTHRNGAIHQRRRIHLDHWMPVDGDLQGAVKTGKFADGYGYDARALPRLNVLVTSSFTGWNNYMMNLGKLMADAEAMKHFGNTVVVWDLHTLQPKKIFDVPGAPLEIALRVGCEPQLLLHRHGAHLEDLADLPGRRRRVAGEGGGRHRRRQRRSRCRSTSRSRPKTTCCGSTRGTTARCVCSTSAIPHAPKQVFDQQIGEQVNMVSESWDGKRVYFTSSLLANWDKTTSTGGDLQFFKLYSWDGKALKPAVQHRLRAGETRRAAPDAFRRVRAVRPEGAGGSGGSTIDAMAHRRSPPQFSRRAAQRTRSINTRRQRCLRRATSHSSSPLPCPARINCRRSRLRRMGPCSTTRATPRNLYDFLRRPRRAAQLHLHHVQRRERLSARRVRAEAGAGPRAGRSEAARSAAHRQPVVRPATRHAGRDDGVWRRGCARRASTGRF